MRLEKVKILGIVYKILYHHELKGDKNELLNGRIDYDKAEILIKHDLESQNILNVIYHEAVHGLSTSMGIDLSEKQVETISNGLLCLVRDNPELFDLRGLEGGLK